MTPPDQPTVDAGPEGGRPQGVRARCTRRPRSDLPTRRFRPYPGRRWDLSRLDAWAARGGVGVAWPGRGDAVAQLVGVERPGRAMRSVLQSYTVGIRTR